MSDVVWAVVSTYYEVAEVKCLCRRESDARSVVASMDDQFLDVVPFPIVSAEDAFTLLNQEKP